MSSGVHNSAMTFIDLKSRGAGLRSYQKLQRKILFLAFFWFLEVPIVWVSSLLLLPLSSHLFPAKLAKIGLASPLGTNFI